NAFDNVPQQRLLDVLRIYLPNKRMMRLFQRVVLTETGRGVRQGGNLSPLLLNVYLGHFLDRKWRQLHHDVPMLRSADDILILCRSREQARRVHDDLKALLLPTGMSLKSTPEQAIRDLKGGESTEWLGYALTRVKECLKVSLTEKTWKSLSEKLELDHEKDGSPLRAVDTINGWISQMGPCFDEKEISRVYARIGSLAHNLGFDEIPSREEVGRNWRKAHQRWERCRKVRD